MFHKLHEKQFQNCLHIHVLVSGQINCQGYCTCYIIYLILNQLKTIHLVKVLHTKKKRNTNV